MILLLALSAAHAGGDAPLDPVVALKFHDDARARLVDGRLSGQLDLSRAEALLATYGVSLKPRHTPEADDLIARAEARTGRPQPDLRGTYQVVEPLTPWEQQMLADELSVLPSVDWVQIQQPGVQPPADIYPTTSDYTGQQTYHDLALGGLDGPLVQQWASLVRISDVEYGWETDHEDLEDSDITLEAGVTIPGWVATYGWDMHGTAALGELAAGDNGYGTTGLAPYAMFGTYPEYGNTTGPRRADAIVSAANDSQPGDVILLEMQTVGAQGNYGPAEYDLDVFDATAVAVDAGMLVVAAAGNGTENLDDAAYQSYRDRGDSGAIIVGAGSDDTSHSPLWFSTYGTRVDVQGWGEGVFTLGYGYYATVGGDPRQTYTSVFNGTSSASPIVTAAVAAVSGYAIDTFGAPLDPRGLRLLLIDTGSPQGAGVEVGPFPDVGAAIDALDLDGDLAATSLYGGEDCDDNDASIGPGAIDDAIDGIDQDCDGVDGPPMVLSVDPGVVGIPWGWSVTDASPNENVALIRGRGEAAGSIAGCAIGLDNPKGLDQLTADAYGSGADDVTLPQGASGKTMWVQALERSTCRVSDPVEVVLP